MLWKLDKWQEMDDQTSCYRENNSVAFTPPGKCSVIIVWQNLDVDPVGPDSGGPAKVKQVLHCVSNIFCNSFPHQFSLPQSMSACYTASSGAGWSGELQQYLLVVWDMQSLYLTSLWKFLLVHKYFTKLSKKIEVLMKITNDSSVKEVEDE